MKLKTIVPAKLPPHIHPVAAEREYYKNLRKYADKYNSLMELALREAVPHLKEVAKNEMLRIDGESVRMDTNIEKRISDLFDWVNRELESSFSDAILRSWSKSMASHTNKLGKKNITRLTSAVGLDVEPLLHDRNLNPFFNNVIDENVGLIRSIPTEKEVAFKNALVRGITGDMPRTQIQAIIMKHIGKNGNVKNRARLIATDQTNKLNASLNEYRQKQLGGTRYRWKNSQDTRVAGNPSGKYPHAKPSHWDRQNKIYLWSKPPEGGHPGQRVRCRCTAEMVIEDVLE